MKEEAFTRTIEENEFSRSAIYAVHGFWSGDSVRVLQSIDYQTMKWATPRINWSCGGEDHKAEPDRTVAAECFAAAIQDAVIIARELFARL